VAAIGLEGPAPIRQPSQPTPQYMERDQSVNLAARCERLATLRSTGAAKDAGPTLPDPRGGRARPAAAHRPRPPRHCAPVQMCHDNEAPHSGSARDFHRSCRNRPRKPLTAREFVVELNSSSCRSRARLCGSRVPAMCLLTRRPIPHWTVPQGPVTPPGRFFGAYHTGRPSAHAIRQDGASDVTLAEGQTVVIHWWVRPGGRPLPLLPRYLNAV
jgi:hypothetical protein